MRSILYISLIALPSVISFPANGGRVARDTLTVDCSSDGSVAGCCATSSLQFAADGSISSSSCTMQQYGGGEPYSVIPCGDSGTGESNTGLCCSGQWSAQGSGDWNNPVSTAQFAGPCRYAPGWTGPAPTPDPPAPAPTTTDVSCGGLIAACCVKSSISGDSASNCYMQEYIGGEPYGDIQCTDSGASGTNTGLCCTGGLWGPDPSLPEPTASASLSGCTAA